MNSKKMQLLREEDRETLFRFIEHYKLMPHLWDPNNEHYKNKQKRLQGLSILASEYNMEINSVTRKIKSLRTYFAHQHNRVVQMRTGPDPNYESPWVAYKHLLFIARTYKDNKDPLTSTESERSTSSKRSQPTVKSEVATDSESDGYSDTEPTIEANIEELSIDTTTNDPFDYNLDFRPKKRKTEVKQKSEQERDEVTIFSELMMYKMRKLNSQNRLIAQNKINNILFELEMEEMKGNL